MFSSMQEFFELDFIRPHIYTTQDMFREQLISVPNFLM